MNATGPPPFSDYRPGLTPRGPDPRPVDKIWKSPYNTPIFSGLLTRRRAAERN